MKTKTPKAKNINVWTIRLLCVIATSLLVHSTQAALIVTVAKDHNGHAIVGLSASGNSISTTAGTWDTSGAGAFLNLTGNIVQNHINYTVNNTYASQGLYVESLIGIRVGTQTNTLDRLSFREDGTDGLDDFSLAFGNGTIGRTWDTSEAALIEVLDTNFYRILQVSDNQPISFDNTFVDGTFEKVDGDNIFWGGNGNGISLVVDANAIPEPVSSLFLGITLIGTLFQRRR